MNEIIGPIYYVLSSDPDPEWSKYAEHDTFYCFTRVMSEIRDNFIQSMDESTSGIHANMSKGKIESVFEVIVRSFSLYSFETTRLLRVANIAGARNQATVFLVSVDDAFTVTRNENSRHYSTLGYAFL